MPYEIDFLPVGDAGDSGDAIALRFTHPISRDWVHVVIDAGFRDDGEALVSHVREHYGTDHVDLAILTHPDGDHIGGMGEVLRGLDVGELWLHDLASHGGKNLPAASAIAELSSLAHEQGTAVKQAWAGATAFGGALTILGPDETYYTELVSQQISKAVLRESIVGKALHGAVHGLTDRLDRISGHFGIEIPFDAKDVTPRNESSMITFLEVDGRASLFTGDAGIEALGRGLDFLEAEGRPITDLDLHFVQIPHHGSRRNGSSAFLTRLLGPPNQAPFRSAFVSCVPASEKHPSGRIVNAFGRRGCEVHATAGGVKWHHHDTPARSGFYPASPLGPMLEEDD